MWEFKDFGNNKKKWVKLATALASAMIPIELFEFLLFYWKRLFENSEHNNTHTHTRI